VAVKLEERMEGKEISEEQAGKRNLIMKNNLL